MDSLASEALNETSSEARTCDLPIDFCFADCRGRLTIGQRRMGDTDSTLLQFASLLGLSGVGMGAWGAHKLAPMLIEKNLEGSWQTAVLYQLFHAATLVGLASSPTEGKAISGRLLGTGNLMFSGSIYMLCLGVGPRKVWGPTTPIGGLVMMAGWAWLGYTATSSKPKTV